MSLYAWLQVPQLKWTVALPGEKPFHIHYSLAQHSKCGCRNSFHLKNPQIRRTNGMHGSQRHSPGCCSPTHGCPKFLTSVTITQAKKTLYESRCSESSVFFLSMWEMPHLKKTEMVIPVEVRSRWCRSRWCRSRHFSSPAFCAAAEGWVV